MIRILLIACGIVPIISVIMWRMFPADRSVRTNTLTSSSHTYSPVPTLTPTPIPSKVLLKSDNHVFQTFNNCGPAALSMALSFYGIQKTQAELGDRLRPYQNGEGDNDDKSVTLAELAHIAPEFHLSAFHRPNGSIPLLKRFIAAGMPVITRTRLKKEDDIGHFRIITGYDDTSAELIQDDSLQGKNLRYGYTAFTGLWETFGFEYLVLVPPDRVDSVRTILGDEVDEQTAWRHAKARAQSAVTGNPGDLYARLNLSVAAFHTGEYRVSVEEFEKIEKLLPFRTLWYQLEPVLAYFHLGEYGRVFEITDTILTNQNRAYSELYLIRGDIYKKQGNLPAARAEYDNAVRYNVHLMTAREARASIETTSP